MPHHSQWLNFGWKSHQQWINCLKVCVILVIFKGGGVLKCVQGSTPAEGAGQLSLGGGGHPAAGHPAALQPHQARG